MLQLPFFDDSHRTLAARLAVFCEETVAPALRGAEADPLAAGRDAIRMCAAEGLLARLVTEPAPDLREVCLVREALAARSGLADAVFAVQGLGSFPVLRAGGEAVRTHYLPRVASGEAIAAFALTEAEAGSDVRAIRTVARADGPDYVLDGSKTLISNAGIADYYVVFAQTGTERTPARARSQLSAFVVDAETPGLRVLRQIPLMAPHPIGELALDACRVPCRHRLGAEGDGLKIALTTLDRFRPSVGAAACGLAGRAIQEALGHVGQRRQFGQTLSTFQATKLAVADMQTELDAARLLVYRAAWLTDRGQERVTREASIAKLFATEAAQRIVDRSVQLHGGLGVVRGVPVEQLYREVRALRLYEGTSEIQRLIIADHLLGRDDQKSEDPGRSDDRTIGQSINRPMACSFTDHRPPVELWPERIYTLPELQYDPRLNLAAALLDIHVEHGCGDSVAVVHGAARLTYAALQRMVNRIGNGLRTHGVKPGSRVILRMPNRPEFIATWLAVQKIGAVCVSTMPMLRARELTYVIRDSEAGLAVVAEELLEEMEHAVEASATPPTLVTVAGGAEGRPGGQTLEALMAASGEELQPHLVDRDDPAIIAYTSGSMGQPKGASHAVADILASADTYAKRVLGATSTDVFGGHPTLAFTYGLGAGLVFPLRVGGSTVLLDRFSPEALLDLTAREHVTVLSCGATTYKLLLQVPDLERRFDLSAVRLCVSAGEPLPKSVHDEWLERTGIEVLDGLGTTEMFHIFVSARPGDRRAGSIGQAVPGYEVRIVNEALEEVPRGTPGLLAVKGPTGCRYWRKPVRQREYVRNGWNVPNDICIQDADGFLWYQCRNDDLIISAGYNIAGPEVEGVLLEHPAVPGGGRRRLTGRGQGKRPEGIRRAQAGRAGGSGSGRRAPGPVEASAGTVQVPAQD